MNNTERLRKLLEDAWRHGYNKPKGRTIDSSLEFDGYQKIMEDFVNSQLADGKGEGVLDFNELAVFTIIDIVSHDAGLGFYSTKHRKKLMKMFIEQYSAALLSTAGVMKWVKASERLPEETGRYWCYVQELNDLGFSHYQWNVSYGTNDGFNAPKNGRVTHWMPLAQRPDDQSPAAIDKEDEK